MPVIVENSIEVSDIGLTQRRDNANIKKIDFYVSDDTSICGDEGAANFNGRR